MPEGAGAARYERICTVYGAASRLDGAERAAYLDDACGGDDELRERVSAMLAQESSGRAQVDALADERIDAMRERLDRFVPEVTVDPVVAALALGRAGADAPDDDSPLALPERIGRYRIIRKLGEGGMGTILEAEQDQPRRVVALKFLRRTLGTRTSMQRFQREIELLGRLRHPGIAQIHEAGVAVIGGSEQPYFTMELVHGRPFIEFADHHGFGTHARFELAARLCDAVHHAHQHGIIHRDLKPANVLVEEETKSGKLVGQPKVLDFGVARALDSDLQATLRTDVGQLIGTLCYMSPEQVLGDPSAIDVRSDVYALGVLLYELLIGTLPYDVEDCSIPEAARVIREVEPRRASTHSRQLRGDPEIILAKALDKERDRRYQSAAELAADIRRYLADEPIVAHRTTAIYQLRRFARRNRTLVGGVVATMLTLVVGIVGIAKYAIDARESAIVAIRSERASRWHAYRSSISAAALAVETNDMRVATRLLDEAPVEFRGWEWGHLRSRLSQWEAVLEAPGAIRGVICVDEERGEALAALADGGVGVWSMADHRWIGAAATHLEVRTISARVIRGLVAVATLDGEVVLWDRATDAFRSIASDEKAAAESIAHLEWSGDGSSLLGRRTRDVFVADVATGEITGRTDVGAGGASTCAIDNEGRFVAFATTWKLHVWQPRTDEAPRERVFQEHPTALAFHPTRPLVAIGTEFRNIYLLDLETDDVERVLSGHRDDVRALAFSADGVSLASASRDGAIIVWDVARGERLRSFTDPGMPDTLRFTDDGRTILSRASGEAAIRVWSLDREPSSVLGPHASYVYSVACAPDGSIVAAGINHAVRSTPDEIAVWRIDGAVPVLMHVFPGQPQTLAFSQDGTRLWTHEVFDLASGAMVDTLRRAEGFERFGTAGLRTSKRDRFSPDGSVRAVGSRSGSPGALRLSAGASTETIATLIADDAAAPERVHGCAFSPDGRHLASAHDDGTVRIWDLETMAPAAVLRGHTGHAYCVEYTPDGTRLASGSNDNTIRIWSVETSETLLELRGHTSYVYDLVFSPDGGRLFSASGDTTVRMWGAAPADPAAQGKGPP